jgi:hypothetical protein
MSEPARSLEKETHLPSLGLPYGGDLPGGGVVVSPMTVNEWKAFTGAGVEGEHRLSQLLAHCVKCAVDPLDLVTDDRMFLYFQVRNVSLPDTRYGWNVKCDGCSSVFRHEIDLAADLDYRELDPKKWQEPFECVLPSMKKKLGLRLLRGRDERDLDTFASKVRKNSNEPGDPAFFMRYAKHIVTVDGAEVTSVDALQLVSAGADGRGLLFSDMLAIQKAVEENSCGYDPLLRGVSCPRCGYEKDEVLQTSAEFFRPRSLRAVR